MNEKANNHPSRPKNVALEEILKNKGLAEFLITAWGIIELSLDNVILREHNMSTQNPEHKKLLKKSFWEKLEYQLKIGLLATEDIEKVGKLKNKRNEIFHDGFFFPNLSIDEKQAIVDMTFEAVRIIENLQINVFDQKNNQRRLLNSHLLLKPKN